jgi:hypothetical protein
MSKNRGDMLGDLIPRKGAAQTSVPAPEIPLPTPSHPAPAPIARTGRGARKPQAAPAVALAPAQEQEQERTLGMTFRMSETLLGRLKMCALRTRRTQQQVLHDALERELREQGF